MPHTPVLDWTCSQCGASESYQLVPSTSDRPAAAQGESSPLPTLDWSCAHCGAPQTYNLVPMAGAQ